MRVEMTFVAYQSGSAPFGAELPLRRFVRTCVLPSPARGRASTATNVISTRTAGVSWLGVSWLGVLLKGVREL